MPYKWFSHHYQGVFCSLSKFSLRDILSKKFSLSWHIDPLGTRASEHIPKAGNTSLLLQVTIQAQPHGSCVETEAFPAPKEMSLQMGICLLRGVTSSLGPGQATRSPEQTWHKGCHPRHHPVPQRCGLTERKQEFSKAFRVRPCIWAALSQCNPRAAFVCALLWKLLGDCKHHCKKWSWSCVRMQFLTALGLLFWFTHYMKSL